MKRLLWLFAEPFAITAGTAFGLLLPFAVAAGGAWLLDELEDRRRRRPRTNV